MAKETKKIKKVAAKAEPKKVAKKATALKEAKTVKTIKKSVVKEVKEVKAAKTAKVEEPKETKKVAKKPRKIVNKDSGSIDFQIKNFTEKIELLSKHLKIHQHDFDSRRGLLIMVGKRRRLLNYLRKTDAEKYQKVISDLKLKRQKKIIESSIQRIGASNVLQPLKRTLERER